MRCKQLELQSNFDVLSPARLYTRNFRVSTEKDRWPSIPRLVFGRFVVPRRLSAELADFRGYTTACRYGIVSLSRLVSFFAKQRFHEIIYHELVKVIWSLAEADITNWYFQAVGDPEYHSAFRGSV